MNKFTISKDLDNEFILTIKQTGTTLPMEIVDPGDTFVATLYDLETLTEVTGAITTTIEDALNGKIKLSIPTTAVADVVRERGDKIDRYYIKPTHRILLDCNTTNNGHFTARINEVYVD